VLLKVFNDQGSQVIGELDAASAKWLVHPEAVYLHDAETYKVNSLDLENGLCQLTPLLSDYYTMPVQDTIIESFSQQSIAKYQYYTKSYGDLSLRTEINGYRKLRWLTNEVLGEGKVNLPPDFLETKGCWFGLSEQLVATLREQNLWKSDRNDYGPGWPALRARVLARDANR
jgi:DEAD/DEAH box helicase domain-containing protein